MPANPRHIPSDRLHKSNGQGVVRVPEASQEAPLRRLWQALPKCAITH